MSGRNVFHSSCYLEHAVFVPESSIRHLVSRVDLPVWYHWNDWLEVTVSYFSNCRDSLLHNLDYFSLIVFFVCFQTKEKFQKKFQKLLKYFLISSFVKLFCFICSFFLFYHTFIFIWQFFFLFFTLLLSFLVNCCFSVCRPPTSLNGTIHTYRLQDGTWKIVNNLVLIPPSNLFAWRLNARYAHTKYRYGTYVLLVRRKRYYQLRHCMQHTTWTSTKWGENQSHNQKPFSKSRINEVFFLVRCSKVVCPISQSSSLLSLALRLYCTRYPVETLTTVIPVA